VRGKSYAQAMLKCRSGSIEKGFCVVDTHPRCLPRGEQVALWKLEHVGCEPRIIVIERFQQPLPMKD